MVQVSEEILNIQGKAVFPASRKVYVPGTHRTASTSPSGRSP